MNVVGASLKVRAILRVGGLAAAVLSALSTPVVAADHQVDADVIIRTFAPIDELFEYSERRLSVELDIRFELGSARLTAPAQGQLDALAEALRSAELQTQRFLIIGHTDASGLASTNKLLSQRRAGAVKAYLVDRHHVDASRLEVLGLGEEKLKNPIVPESAENRRVEVILRTGDGDGEAVREGSIEW